MTSELDKERYQDKYSDWSGELSHDSRLHKSLTNEEIDWHLKSQEVKDECDYLGITVEQYKERYIYGPESE